MDTLDELRSLKTMSKVKVYLVGDKDSPKNNQWLAMTNDWSEAEKLKAEVGPEATHKVVEVSPPRKGR